MACLANKPSVDALERDFEGRAEVVRVDFRSPAGRTIGARHDVRFVPTFIVFDPSGREVARPGSVNDVRRYLAGR